jgi:hypothetical protein
MSFRQISPPFRAFWNVFAFPMMIRASLARDSITFTRSFDAMKPILLSELLLVRETITISLSSPW